MKKKLDDSQKNVTELAQEFNIEKDMVRSVVSHGNLDIKSTYHNGKYYDVEEFRTALHEYRNRNEKADDDDLDNELKKLRAESLKLDIAERRDNLVPRHRVESFYKFLFILYYNKMKDICYANKVAPDRFNVIISSIKVEVKKYMDTHDLSDIETECEENEEAKEEQAVPQYVII